ncbi:MAG: hypothetical protein WAM28_05895 [Chlamydiales bacterium]
MSLSINFDHIPDSEKEAEWFCLLKPLLNERLARENPTNSRLIQTLIKTEGSHTWETLRDYINNIIPVVENGKRVFSRKEEIRNTENPDNPIEEMFAEFRAASYLIQKGFKKIKYFRQEGSDFQAYFNNRLYFIEVTYIHGPNLKTFHNNPSSIDTLIDPSDKDYLEKRKKLLDEWEYSRKLTNLLKSKYSKKEYQLKKRGVEAEHGLIVIITDLIETYESWFDHEIINGDHPLSHFVKTREIATVLHGAGTVYEPEAIALGGEFGKLNQFSWENYSNQKF